MIPEDFRDELITTGIHFLRCLTRAYGSEHGMEMWDTISEAIDPELKGQIFFAMLTGEYEGNIVLRGIDRTKMPYQKINAIKEVRGLTGMGLTEAKNLVEGLEIGKTATLSCPAKYRANVVDAFRNYGLLVS